MLPGGVQPKVEMYHAVSPLLFLIGIEALCTMPGKLEGKLREQYGRAWPLWRLLLNSVREKTAASIGSFAYLDSRRGKPIFHSHTRVMRISGA